MLKIYPGLILILCAHVFASNPVSVDINDPVYDFLERMETLGFITDLKDGIRPYSRAKVADYLIKLTEYRQKMTTIDLRRLDNYLLDYRYEINQENKYREMEEGHTWYTAFSSWKNIKKDFSRFFKQNHPEEKNYVFMWEDGDNNFYFNYDQVYTYEERSDSKYRSGSWDYYHIRGLLGGHFGYRADISLQAYRGDDEYALEHPNLKGSWSQRPDNGPRYADRSGGEIILRTKFLDISLAQQEVQWGVGESGKLTLSNYAEQYPYLSLVTEWSWGKFIALHGKLQSFQSDTLDDDYPVYPDKWVAAHRFEFSPFNWATFGINETFIYGYRYMDWAYLFPLNFYRTTQHKLRDRDNATISLDAEFLPFNTNKVYGAIFLDEFKQSKLGTNWFGNKFGIMAGIYQVDPFGIPNLSLCFEYIAIRPFTYTHKYLINSYTTDFRSLGYWAGPNSEVIYLHIRKDWHHRLITGFKFQQWSHGANSPDENLGGDIFIGGRTLLGSQTQLREEIVFLEGILTIENKYHFYAQYEIFNDFYLSGKYTHCDTDTEGDKKA
ncbi:MAG: hypothetical protein JXB44_04085 [Calditrichaceae bacterium]|nr:hypothetical protein [Calditrichaceae bacterium]RQV96496.1 MAG: hypothetical protein EH224_04565 [Calditrichota bacterium]